MRQFCTARPVASNTARGSCVWGAGEGASTHLTPYLPTPLEAIVEGAKRRRVRSYQASITRGYVVIRTRYSPKNNRFPYDMFVSTPYLVLITLLMFLRDSVSVYQYEYHRASRVLWECRAAPLHCTAVVQTRPQPPESGLLSVADAVEAIRLRQV